MKTFDIDQESSSKSARSSEGFVHASHHQIMSAEPGYQTGLLNRLSGAVDQRNKSAKNTQSPVFPTGRPWYYILPRRGAKMYQILEHDSCIDWPLFTVEELLLKVSGNRNCSLMTFIDFKELKYPVKYLKYCFLLLIKTVFFSVQVLR